MTEITIKAEKQSKILSKLLREADIEVNEVRMWRGHKLNAGSLVRKAATSPVQ